MNLSTPPAGLQNISRVRDFFLARQPILDRNQSLVAYELLFRGGATGPARFSTDLAATASVISHVSQLGLENVIGNSLGYLNVDAAVLTSDIVEFLPREKVILEIVETTKVTAEILERIAALVKIGFRFALDDVVTDSEDVQKLLPLIEVVKLDLRDMPVSALLKLTPWFKSMNKKVLAEKVESVEQFELCLGLGFDYFQGYYFAKPLVLSGKKLSPSQLAITKLMRLIATDADSAVLEAAIKDDVSIGLSLLRLVNSAAIAVRKRIDSLSQALLVLGRTQLQRWLQIMLFAEPCRSGATASPLLMLATTRGKMLELIAQKVNPHQRNVADTAFTVGIMSLMDTLFQMSMVEILEQIAVVDDVSDALLRRKGSYGDMLKLVEYVEHVQDALPLIEPLLKRLQLSNDDLCTMEVAAFAWSNEICGNVL